MIDTCEYCEMCKKLNIEPIYHDHIKMLKEKVNGKRQYTLTPDDRRKRNMALWRNGSVHPFEG